MKLKLWPVCLAVLASCTFSQSAHAGVGLTKLLFSMPSGFDPRQLNIQLLGAPYITDSGPNGPQLITGSTLLPSGANGLNVFNRLPKVGNAYQPITELDFVTDYTGDLQFTSTVDPLFNPDPTNPNYDPWVFELQLKQNGLQYFRAYARSTSAPILERFDFALLQADTTDSTFAASHLGVVAYDTVSNSSTPRYTANPFTPIPEASTVLSFGVLMTGGAGLLLCRRRPSA